MVWLAGGTLNCVVRVLYIEKGWVYDKGTPEKF
jgi:hypothetical protein